MSEPMYSSFRLLISSRLGGGAGYRALSLFQLYSEETGGDQLLVGGEASASSFFDSDYLPDFAFLDNGKNWFTKSLSSSEPVWIRYDLPSPVLAPKSLYLQLTVSDTSSAPGSFVLQASSDSGSTWVDLFATSNFADGAGYSAGVLRDFRFTLLRGNARTIDNSPADRVAVYGWDNMQYIAHTVPDAFGNWVVQLSEVKNISTYGPYLVVVYGGQGVKPDAHGPVIPDLDYL